MDQYLNEPSEEWTPWQADEEMLYLIITGQLVPPKDETREEQKPLSFPLAA